MKGLLCSILEDKRIGNCSNNGISNRFDQVILVGAGIAEIFEPSEDCPAVKLIRRNIGGEYLSVEPIDRDESKTPYMAGGAFIYSSDSRFPSSYPIPLHDRQETWSDYKMLSN